jgi:hypothetical protein
MAIELWASDLSKKKMMMGRFMFWFGQLKLLNFNLLGCFLIYVNVHKWQVLYLPILWIWIWLDKFNGKQSMMEWNGNGMKLDI